MAGAVDDSTVSIVVVTIIVIRHFNKKKLKNNILYSAILGTVGTDALGGIQTSAF